MLLSVTHVLLCVQWVEAQKLQKEALDNIKEAKDFDSVGRNTQRCNRGTQVVELGGKLQIL